MATHNCLKRSAASAILICSIYMCKPTAIYAPARPSHSWIGAITCRAVSDSDRFCRMLLLIYFCHGEISDLRVEKQTLPNCNDAACTLYCPWHQPSITSQNPKALAALMSFGRRSWFVNSQSAASDNGLAFDNFLPTSVSFSFHSVARCKLQITSKYVNSQRHSPTYLVLEIGKGSNG